MSITDVRESMNILTEGWNDSLPDENYDNTFGENNNANIVQGEVDIEWTGDDGELADGMLYYTASVGPNGELVIDPESLRGSVHNEFNAARVSEQDIESVLSDPHYKQEYLEIAQDDLAEEMSRDSQSMEEGMLDELEGDDSENTMMSVGHDEHDHNDKELANEEEYQDNYEDDVEFNNGDQVMLTSEYEETPGEVYTLSQWDGDRGWIGDSDGRGWSIRSHQIVHAADDDEMYEGEQLIPNLVIGARVSIQRGSLEGQYGKIIDIDEPDDDYPERQFHIRGRNGEMVYLGQDDFVAESIKENTNALNQNNRIREKTANKLWYNWEVIGRTVEQIARLVGLSVDVVIRELSMMSDNLHIPKLPTDTFKSVSESIKENKEKDMTEGAETLARLQHLAGVKVADLYENTEEVDEAEEEDDEAEEIDESVELNENNHKPDCSCPFCDKDSKPADEDKEEDKEEVEEAADEDLDEGEEEIDESEKLHSDPMRKLIDSIK